MFRLSAPATSPNASTRPHGTEQAHDYSFRRSRREEHHQLAQLAQTRLNARDPPQRGEEQRLHEGHAPALPSRERQRSKQYAAPRSSLGRSATRELDRSPSASSTPPFPPLPHVQRPPKSTSSHTAEIISLQAGALRGACAEFCGFLSGAKGATGDGCCQGMQVGSYRATTWWGIRAGLGGIWVRNRKGAHGENGARAREADCCGGGKESSGHLF